MKLEYMKIVTQAHPCVAELYDDTPAHREMLGPGNPFESRTTRGDAAPKSLRVVRPSVHDLMVMNHDEILASPDCLNGSYISKPYEGWHGGSFEEMVARRKGWPDGVKKMQEAIRAMIPEGVFAQRPRPHWAEEGYDFDLDRFRDSNDRFCMNRELRRGPRNISLGVHYGENCTTDPESLFFRGAATVAAVDTLETLGYRCDLTAINCGTNTWTTRVNEMCVMLIEVKKASEPLDLDYITSVVASPLFFRGNIFAWYWANPAVTHGNLGRNQGAPKCFWPDVMINTLPTTAEEARLLYDNIIRVTHETASRKFLTSGQQEV